MLCLKKAPADTLQASSIITKSKQKLLTPRKKDSHDTTACLQKKPEKRKKKQKLLCNHHFPSSHSPLIFSSFQFLYQDDLLLPSDLNHQFFYIPAVPNRELVAPTLSSPTSLIFTPLRRRHRVLIGDWTFSFVSLYTSVSIRGKRVFYFFLFALGTIFR